MYARDFRESTKLTEISDQNSVFPWKDAGYRYYPYGYFLKQKFGERVQKVSIVKHLAKSPGRFWIESIEFMHLLSEDSRYPNVRAKFADLQVRN